jgi:hypothetical protein
MRALFEASSDTERDVLVAQGIQGVPAAGDPCFMSQCRQSSYLVTPESNPVALTVKFSQASGTSTALNGGSPWGIILNTDVTARTAANTANGVNQIVTTSSKGGWMMYHVITSAGSGGKHATIKVQDCDTAGGTYADIVSSGVIDTAAGISGAVALAVTATVRQYVRWQVVFGTGGDELTSITFVLGFARNLV